MLTTSSCVNFSSAPARRPLMSVILGTESGISSRSTASCTDAPLLSSIRHVFPSASAGRYLRSIASSLIVTFMVPRTSLHENPQCVHMPAAAAAAPECRPHLRRTRQS